MTSREIIIRLIDQKLITGEEAVILLNDVLHDELRQAWENLKSQDEPKNQWYYTYPPTTTITGIGTDAVTTLGTSISTYTGNSK